MQKFPINMVTSYENALAACAALTAFIRNNPSATPYIRELGYWDIWDLFSMSRM